MKNTIRIVVTCGILFAVAFGFTTYIKRTQFDPATMTIIEEQGQPQLDVADYLGNTYTYRYDNGTWREYPSGESADRDVHNRINAMLAQRKWGVN